MKHIICFSGGHSSALVALEVANRYGTENMILLNHDISSNVELEDIKRFKKEVASYLGLPITYANYKDLDIVDKDQFDISLENKGFGIKTPKGNNVLCTSRLKTEPFENFLKTQSKDSIIYYGFDVKEKKRIERRKKILENKGFKSDYPLALWYSEDLEIYNKFDQLDFFNKENDKLKPIYIGSRKIKSTLDIGIKPPDIYKSYKHANCIGCLKGSKQHWYIVYCLNNDIFNKAKETEKLLSNTIFNNESLSELEPLFKQMKENNIPANQNIETSTFWYLTKKKVNIKIFDEKSLNSCNLFECTG